MSGNSGPRLGKIFSLIGLSAATVVGVYSAGSLFETLDAGQVMVIQSPFTGKLSWYMDPGIKPQFFGKVTKYDKRGQYWFSSAKDQGKSLDQSIKVRFNDGGHANISGGLSYELPLDDKALTNLHTKFPTMDAVEQSLIRPTVEKAVYLTGPMMSSKESAAEKRPELLRFIEDQVQHGVYRTQTQQVQKIDTLTSQVQTVSTVLALKDQSGQEARVEPSPLEEFKIRTFNFTLNEIRYDDIVEQQIMQQQKATMEIQTAMAQARKAEQQAITSEKEGQAAAAKAKWEQEVLKARAVTEAEQQKSVALTRAEQEKSVALTKATQEKEVAETAANQKLRVAELAAKEAEQYKVAETLKGEGDAARLRAAMEANGALEVKLKAYVAVNEAWARAIAEHQGSWVPSVLMGNGGSNGSGNGSGVNVVSDLVQMLSAKTARDLALDLSTTSSVRYAQK